VSRRVDDLLAGARARIGRVQPGDLAAVVETGGLVVDIRPEVQRRSEGALPGAVVLERNVLEWRLDPQGDHRIPDVRDHDQQVVVVCSAGYASSLAAAVLVDLGFSRAGDLDGGYLAWRAWSRTHAVAAGVGR
jgi:rhodanese-related sulfurtransferase